MQHVNVIESCCFCREFVLEVPAPESRLVAESEHSLAFPSLGALAPGHLLVIPKNHWSSLRSLPEEVFNDLVNLSQRLSTAMTSRFGPVFKFEHGVPSDSGGGCGIDHAHLHLIPVPPSLTVSALLPSLGDSWNLKSIQELKRHPEAREPYLFMEESSGAMRITSAEKIPSQYLRKLLAPFLGLENWNWRDHPYNERFFATLQICKSEWLGGGTR